jgi:hypothetical protein
MNKKGISTWAIVGIVVIIIIVAGIVAYVLYSGGGEETPTPTPTPTPSGSPVEGASSITFDVNATVSGAEEFDKFTAKNLDTDGILLRVDQMDAQGNKFVYILNQTAQSVWADFGTGFIDESANYQTYADNTLIGYVALHGYLQELANWSGSGSYDFTHNSDSFVISNIFVDPSVPDSVFSHE